MSPICELCTKSTEPVLVFPCCNKYKACRRCLQTRVIDLGGPAVKCPGCSRVHGMVDFDLWAVEGGLIPNQQQCQSCDEGKEKMAARYCLHPICVTPLCADCFNDKHEPLHNGRHETISFDEYRMRSDTFRNRECDSSHNRKAIFACNNCNKFGCDYCRGDRDNCAKGGSHEFVDLSDKFHQAKEAVARHQAAVQSAQATAKDQDLQGLRQSMQTHSEHIEQSRSNLKAVYEAQIKQLEKDYHKLDKKLKDCKRKIERQTEPYEARLETFVESLQKTLDSLGAIPDSYHQARLVESEEAIRQLVEQALIFEKTEINFITPQLKETTVNRDNLLGLFLDETRHLATKPSSIKFTKPIRPSAGKNTFTVSHSSVGTLEHGGKSYVSLIGLKTDCLVIDCIRFDAGGNPMMLEKDEAKKKSAIVTYERKTLPGEQILYDKLRSRPVVNTKKRSHFVQIDDDTICQTGYDSNEIFFEKSGQGAMKKNLKAAGMTRPWGICRHKDQVFIACYQAVMAFSLKDPSKTLRKIATADAQLSGIAYHRGYLYATKWSDWAFYKSPKIFVFTTEGELVKSLEIPEADNYVCDISIDEDGSVAVASWNQGVVIYQLNFEE